MEHCLYGPHWAKKIWVVFFFLTRKCMAVLPGSQSGRNNEMTELPRLPLGGVSLYIHIYYLYKVLGEELLARLIDL